MRRHLFLMLMAGGALAGRVAAQGRLSRCEKIAQQVLRQALAQRGHLPEPASITLTALSRVYYERYQLQQAEQFRPRDGGGPEPHQLQPANRDCDPARPNSICPGQCRSGSGDAGSRAGAARPASGAHFSRAGPDRLSSPGIRPAWAGRPRRTTHHRNWGARDHPLVRYVWAEILLRQGRWVEAENNLTQLLADHPDGFYDQPGHGLAVMLATALYEQQKLNQAQALMADVVRRAAPPNALSARSWMAAPAAFLCWPW